MVFDNDNLYCYKEGIDAVPVETTEWIQLNVGGTLVTTTLTTLTSHPGSMLAKLVGGPIKSGSSSAQPAVRDSNGAFMLDRDPKYFLPLLNFLRTGNLVLDGGINPAGVLEEARFFNIEALEVAACV